MTGTRWILRASVVLALAASIALSGCGDSSPPSTYIPAVSQRPATHVVVAGDTVFRIANEYGVGIARLMAANGLRNPRELRVGQVLTIPGAYGAASIGTASRGVHPYTGERESRQFQWPVAQGVVSSGFGIRNGAMHSGVDIAAPAGTPVLAADSGVVIFSGTLHGYGNTVIIRHDDSYATVYAHPDSKSGRSDAPGARPAPISTSRSVATTSPGIRSPFCPSPQLPAASALPRPAAASIVDHRTRES
jgi:LysM repeat protein